MKGLDAKIGGANAGW